MMGHQVSQPTTFPNSLRIISTGYTAIIVKSDRSTIFENILPILIFLVLVSYTDSAHLGEDDDLVATLVKLGHKSLKQCQLATLLPQLLGARVHNGAVHAPRDQVRVVAVLAHLHEDIVQPADDVGPVQPLLDGLLRLLWQGRATQSG